jgi:nitroreductase
MNIQQAIRERRAVKHFDPAHTFSAAEEKELLDLVRQSPTSFNIQNWRFVVVKNPEQKQKIRAAAWDQAQITDAALVFVICADLRAWDKNPERYWADAPQAARDFLVPMIKPFYEGKEQLQRDEAMRSVGIAAQTLMLAAKGMGYDSCPMIGFDPQALASLINLPADHTIGMIVTVGKALKPAQPKGGYIDHAEVFKTDRFEG